MRIDAHQHFWRLARNECTWITPELGAIYRDFQPEDLQPELEAACIEATVLVQAAPTESETEYLLDLATRTRFVAGVVGWVDMEALDAPERIARLAAEPKLVGIRPMIQDIADDDWMLGSNLAPAYQALVAHGLCFDALVMPWHLPRLARLLDRYPDLRVVVDHGAKPRIRDRDFDGWAGDLARLGEVEGLHCKLSGLVTEANADWREADLRPYMEHLLACFGPARLMWGSDWPVVNLAASYDRWWHTASGFVRALDEPDQCRVLGETASAFYRLAG